MKNPHYPYYLYSRLDYGRGLLLTFYGKEPYETGEVVVNVAGIPNDALLNGTVVCGSYTDSNKPTNIWVMADPIKAL